MNPADGSVPVADNPQTMTVIRLAGSIRNDAARVLANWSMRVATLPAFRAFPELALDDLQQDMPDLLDAILEAVIVSPYELDPTLREVAAARAEAHGVKRSECFPIEVVLSEIQILQREVRNSIWRHAQETPVAIVRELDERLYEVFGIAQRSAAAAWVRSRYKNVSCSIDGESA